MSTGRVQLDVKISATDDATVKAKAVAKAIDGIGESSAQTAGKTKKVAESLDEAFSRAQAEHLEDLNAQFSELADTLDNELSAAIEKASEDAQSFSKKFSEAFKAKKKSLEETLGFSITDINSAFEIFNKLAGAVRAVVAEIEEMVAIERMTDAIDNFASVAGKADEVVAKLEDDLGLDEKAATEAALAFLRTGASMGELEEATRQASAMNKVFRDDEAEVLSALIAARSEGVEPFEKKLADMRAEVERATGSIQDFGFRLAYARTKSYEMAQMQAQLAAAFFGVADAADVAAGKKSREEAYKSRMATDIQAQKDKIASVNARIAAEKEARDLEEDWFKQQEAADWAAMRGGGGAKRDKDKSAEFRPVEPRKLKQYEERNIAKLIEDLDPNAAAERWAEIRKANEEAYIKSQQAMRDADADAMIKYADAATYLGKALSEMPEHAKGFGEAADSIAAGFQAMSGAIKKGDEQAIVGAVAGTMMGITEALKLGRKEQAAIEILAETAMSIAAFVMQDYAGGVGHASAALAWGAVAMHTGGGGATAAAAAGPRAGSTAFGSRSSASSPMEAGPTVININGTLFSTAQQVGSAVSRGIREARRGGMDSAGRV